MTQHPEILILGTVRLTPKFRQNNGSYKYLPPQDVHVMDIDRKTKRFQYSYLNERGTRQTNWAFLDDRSLCVPLTIFKLGEESGGAYETYSIPNPSLQEKVD